jgi:hypothetical protein
MLENGKNSLVAAVDKVEHEFSVVMLASLKSRFEPYIKHYFAMEIKSGSKRSCTTRP